MLIDKQDARALTEINTHEMNTGWSPKIPKRPNFRFSPDVWVVPNEKVWASAQKQKGGGKNSEN